MKKKLNSTMIFLKWSQLKFLPSNRLIKSMGYWLFIVPIAAKILSHVNTPVLLKLYDYDLHLDLSLPFSWYAFFFSALFFSVGNIFYMIWCPTIVKDHLSFAGFFGDGKTIEHLEDYANEISINFDKLNYDNTASPNLELKRIFWFIYKEAIMCRTIKRGFCVVSYYIGFIFAIYVVLSNVIWVIRSCYS